MTFRNLLILAGTACSLLCALTTASAHKLSDSYLAITVHEGKLEGQWDISLRDLEYAVGLDTDHDGKITWGELRARQGAVAATALAHLKLTADGQEVPLRVTDQLVDTHTDGAYAVIRFEGQTTGAPQKLEVGYTFFFDLDPLHRGLLRLQNGEQVRTAVFGPDSTAQSFDVAASSHGSSFLSFVREGVVHIWIGYDHILFLVALLLPSILRRVDGAWRPQLYGREVATNVLKIVTAFTVAHSLTLTLATLGYAHLPSRVVESCIALTVVLAALNNLFPVVCEKSWAVAFLFGLIHGFGFASVLVELDLPRSELVASLIGFNLGVEIGQLAIVAVLLPILYCMRDTFFYRRIFFPVGSSVIALIASLWMAERVFNLSLLPF